MNWMFGFVAGFIFCRLMVWLENKFNSFFKKIKEKKENEKPFANQFISSMCECGASRTRTSHTEWCPVKKFP